MSVQNVHKKVKARAVRFLCNEKVNTVSDVITLFIDILDTVTVTALSEPTLEIVTADQQGYDLEEGDWLVRDENGEIEVLSDTDFQKKYK